MDQTTSTLLIGAAMIAVFVAAWWRGVPHIISLSFAALVGAIVAGEGVPLRHLVEGSFMFFDLVVIILTATIFIGVVKETGALQGLIRDITQGFHNRPLVLLSMMTLVVMLPGALTGSGTAAVLAVGSLVGSVLVTMGIPLAKAVSIVALAGIVGSFAPPINIPAMAMANGINMPYVGLDLALAVISIPLGILTALWLGARYLREKMDAEALLEVLGQADSRSSSRVGTYTPFVVLLGVMVVLRVFHDRVPDIGVPLVFVVGTIVAWLLSPKAVNILEVSKKMLREAMPVASILIGVGAFVQIMTLTGVRGLFVITAITLPLLALYLFTFFGFAIAGSLLGSYGSGVVFGIPVALAFLDRDPIMAIVGLSLLAAYSSLTPPTAIVGQASIVAMEYRRGYGSILKIVSWPWILASIVGILVVIYADRLGFLVWF